MIEVHLIWAQDDNGGIGINGKLPWHISSDLKNFKKITLNSTILFYLQKSKTMSLLTIHIKNVLIIFKKRISIKYLS